MGKEIKDFKELLEGIELAKEKTIKEAIDFADAEIIAWEEFANFLSEELKTRKLEKEGKLILKCVNCDDVFHDRAKANKHQIFHQEAFKKLKKDIPTGFWRAI